RALTTEIEALDGYLAAWRGDLCDRIHQLIGLDVTAEARRSLLDLKRAIYNGRPPPTDVRPDDLAHVLGASPGLDDAIARWEAACRRREELMADAERQVASDDRAARCALRALFTRSDFQDGLLFAQPRLYERLQAYLAFSGDRLPKRLRHVEL